MTLKPPKDYYPKHMEGQKDEGKLSKKDFDFTLYQRYGETISNFSKAFTENFSPEEAVSAKELDLAIVLTTFPKPPMITPHNAKKLNERMTQVKSDLYKKAWTDKFKVALDQLSARRIIDTLDGEVEKLELAGEKPDGKHQPGDAQIVKYLKAAKEVAQLAVMLQQENS